MQRIAVIEDDRPTSKQLCEWIKHAFPEAQIDQYFDRTEAEAGIKENEYDVISLDIELGAERNAGVALIKEATRVHPVPVLVVSGMPADLYRGVMKALDAWDYLQKPVGEHDFIQTLFEISKLADNQRSSGDNGDLIIDPLTHVKPMWKGMRLNLTATQQRLLHAIYARRSEPDSTITYNELFERVASGKNKDNIKRQVSQIKAAFREIDPNFNSIVAETMRGYRWVSR